MYKATRSYLLLIIVLVLTACAPASEQQPLPTLAVLPSLTPPAEAVIRNETIPTAKAVAAQPSPSAIPAQPSIAPNDTPATKLPAATSIPAAAPIPTSAPIVQPPPAQPVQNQLVIRFAPGASPAEQQQYLKSIGGTVENQIVIGQSTSVVVQVPAGVTLDSLATSPVVAASEPDYVVSAQVVSQPNDPYFDQQWALPMMNVPQAWPSLPEAPSAVAVAVIDSGICADHPDLQGRILPGWDFVEDDSTPQDTFGHGCAVAGIIAANLDNGAGIAGVAPNAQIMPLRVLDERGLGTYSNVAAALAWAADNGANIINLSLGGANPSATLESAVQYAVSKGVMVIAAAGNTGSDTLLYPAAYGDVIAVGSVDASGARSSFSSTNAGIDLWAPGANIHSTSLDGGYTSSSGTSFAAPQAAGVAALEMAFGRTLMVDGSVAHIEGSQPVTTVTPVPSPTFEGTATVATDIDDPSQTSTYENDTFDFGFRYPSGMTSKTWQPIEDILYSASFYLPTTDLPYTYQISVTVFDNPNLLSVEEWAKQYATRENPRETLTDFDTLRSLEIDTHPAVLYAHFTAGIPTARLLIEGNGRIVSLSYTHFDSSELRLAFTTIAASFKLTDSVNTLTINSAFQQALADELDTLELAPLPEPTNKPQVIPLAWGYKLPWRDGVAYQVTQDWGPGYSHKDISLYAYDFGIVQYDEVRAVRAGTVSISVGAYSACGGGDYADYGNRVVVNHDDGTATLYLHLQRVNVSVGSTVYQGDKVGESGNVGWTDCGVHLHFQRQYQGGSYWMQSVPIYFDETQNGLLDWPYYYTSQNSRSVVPNAPSNLTATPISQREIRLTWTDNSTNETGFVVQLSTDGANYSDVTTVAAGQTTYTVSNLRCDTSYTFRVRAVANSQQSNPAQTGPAGTLPCTVPGTPTLIAPVNGAITNDNTPALSWNPVTNAVKYWIQIATDSAFKQVVQDAKVTTTSYTATTLADKLYYWRVSALNSADQPGAWSGYRTFTIDTTPPAAPILKSPSDGVQVTTARPAFTWNAAATATKYRIQVSTAADFSSTVIDVPNLTTLAYTATTSLPQGVYYWRVQAWDTAGNGSAFSSDRSVKLSIQRVPADDAITTLTRPTFSWYAYAGTVGYQLQVDDNADFSSPLTSESLAATRLSYIPPTPMAHSIYYWRVNVNTGSGFVPSPFVRTLTITPALPPAPVLLTPATNLLTQDTTPDFGWNPVNAAGSPFTYQLQVDNDSLFRSPACDLTTSETTSSCAPLADARYYWRVRTVNYLNAPGKWSAYRIFTVDTTPPSTPILRTPADGGMVRAARPAFGWYKTATASRYHIQIAADESFGAIIVEADNIASTAYTATISLPQSGFWWRVKAKDAAGNWGSFSTPFSFDVNIQRAPADNAIMTLTRPSFTWYAYTGAVGYQLQVDVNADFSSPIISEALAAGKLSYIPPTPMTSNIYYWRVNVNTGSGFTVSPFYWTFTVSPALPPAPVLLLPSVNALTSDNTPDFTWSPVNVVGGPFTYQLQVDNDSLFRSPECDLTTSDTTSSCGPLADGRYYWRVRTVNYLNAPGKWSAYRLFTIDTTPPPVPVLMTPANGASLATNLPVLTWNASSGAVSYEVSLGITTPTTVVYTGSARTWTPPAPLLLKTYAWTVRAKDSAGNWSAYSDAWNFSIVSAANAMAYRWRFTSNTPTLRWTPISWASAYQVQVDNISTFASPEYQSDSIPSNSTTTTALQPGLYYWRVRAKDATTGTWGAWSVVESFFIDLP